MKSLAEFNIPTVTNVIERFNDLEPPYFDQQTVGDICGIPVAQLDSLDSTPEILKRGSCLFMLTDPVICVAPMQERWVLLAPAASRQPRGLSVRPKQARLDSRQSENTGH
jgi:hypothetical protein